MITYFVVSFYSLFTDATVLPSMSTVCALRCKRSDERSVSTSATGNEDVSVHRAMALRNMYTGLQIFT